MRILVFDDLNLSVIDGSLSLENSNLILLCLRRFADFLDLVLDVLDLILNKSLFKLIGSNRLIVCCDVLLVSQLLRVQTFDGLLYPLDTILERRLLVDCTLLCAQANGVNTRIVSLLLTLQRQLLLVDGIVRRVIGVGFRLLRGDHVLDALEHLIGLILETFKRLDLGIDGALERLSTFHLGHTQQQIPQVITSLTAAFAHLGYALTR